MDFSAIIGNPVVSAVIGGGAALAATRMIQLARIVPYLGLIQRVFQVIDPVLNENIKQYSASDVRFAISLAVSVIADGNITPKEVSFVVDQVQRRWFPTQAAGKTISQLPTSSAQRVIAESIASALSGPLLTNGVPSTSLINSIRAKL